MRKSMSFLLAILVLLASFQLVASAEVAGTLTMTTYGKVVEVIDADALVVQLGDGSLAYVRLLGVDASSKEGGLKYMQDHAFGKQVVLVPDLMAPLQGNGRWNYMYVYLTASSSVTPEGESLNQALVRLGYAEVDASQTYISQYAALNEEQDSAKSKKTGIWDDGLTTGSQLYANRININTASVKVMEEAFTGTIPSGLLENIVSFRKNAPFAQVEDIKFVKSMTKEFFDNNRYQMSVITNINTASETELRSLSSSSDANIKKVLEYREKYTFDDIEELYDDANVTSSYYRDNRHYISVDDETPMTHGIPERTVNINTATSSQLSAISDVSSSQASSISGGRRQGYSYKSLGELKGLNSSFNLDKINKLSDNLHVYTDINYASTREMESLFGSNYFSGEIEDIIDGRTYSGIEGLKEHITDSQFEEIEDYIYVSERYCPDRINLNTAKTKQLEELGMTSTERRKIINAQGDMKRPRDIPFNVAEYDDEVTLFTNINTASRLELESLNVFKDSAMDAILSYTSSQPFGSYDELEKFLKAENALDDYEDVEEFIILR